MAFEYKPGMIVGLCNPLLDIVANVDEQFLNKWDLKANNAILAEPKHDAVIEELAKYPNIKYLAGGSVQNTLRMVQWVVNQPKTCTYFGAIGKDFFGQCMQTKAEEDGLNVVYQVSEELPTGVCVVAVSNNGRNRSLIAKLAAANEFTHSFLQEHQSELNSALLCYASGFHITSCSKAVMALAQHCYEATFSGSTKKTFVFNLSAPFVSQFYPNEVKTLFPYCDIVFGNETETLEFAKLMEWTEANGDDATQEDRLKVIAKKMADLERFNGTQQPRVVVVTQGCDPIIVALANEKDVRTFPVERLNDSQIVDTNGAGDAFVGGFISQYVAGQSLEKCIRWAAYCSKEIIQQDGFTLPAYRPRLE